MKQYDHYLSTFNLTLKHDTLFFIFAISFELFNSLIGNL